MGVEIKTCCNRFDLLTTYEHERQVEIQAELMRKRQSERLIQLCPKE